MAAKKELSFEEALEKLELSAEALKNDNVSLEEALKSFEQGIEYYNKCNAILNNAKQKIEFYSKQ
ncbi:exodeoxyribonuclease VII small subunit [Aminipila sp.]|jgi:exodeoxyribonuclease VII small subunit|uniref:exodeoxyribonuclease VII small subunit n=1 Tax=Aminipila sp. TaxID=2060095 RepID=UPI001D96E980|nr:exodeoxyribonuclease VII small subunit [Aminipila sp.]MBE6033909.1 exodeoxyribonuclease VII small subunit [Clostridiales bacterium]